MELEKRIYPVELRVQKREGKLPMIMGHAAVFNTLSEDLGGYREMVIPGAFKRTLQSADVRSFLNHDPNLVLGRNKAGTMRLEEDDQGLMIEVDPPDTQYARDLCVSIERGDISQMSFMFYTVAQRWREDGTVIVRDLIDVDLLEAGPCSIPAYPTTDVGVRSAISDIIAGGKPARDVTAQLNALFGQVANSSASESDFQVDLDLRKRKLGTLI